MIAYVDESGGTDAARRRWYIVVAAVSVGDEDHARDQLRRLLLPGADYLHWRDESERRQRLIVDTLLTLDLAVYPTATVEAEPRGQEQARRRCLSNLVERLPGEGVKTLMIETRQRSGDRHDRETFLYARQRRHEIRYEHVDKRSDPLLWIADAVAGVTSTHLTGRNSDLYAVLSEGLIWSLVQI